MSEVFGEGARRAWLLRPAADPRAVVLFLHGSGETGPDGNEPWLEHLAEQGAAVVYPQYQAHADVHGATLLDDLAAGLAAAWDAIGRPGLPFAAIGISRGAFLAVHHAARAAGQGRPVPAAILGVVPGTLPGDQRADLRLLPPHVDITLLVGDRDELVGRDGAELLIADLAYHPPERLRVLELESREGFVADHGAPMRSDPASRAVFWHHGDVLLERVS
jgi:alpha-beta hydrolase superfamily lysophospholipase